MSRVSNVLLICFAIGVDGFSIFFFSIIEIASCFTNVMEFKATKLQINEHGKVRFEGCFLLRFA